MRATKSQRTLVEAAIGGLRQSSNGWLRGACPICPTLLFKEDRKLSFGLHLVTGRFHCFRCSVTGRLRVDDIDLPDVDNVPLAPEVRDDSSRPPEDYTPLASHDGGAMCLAPARAYLTKRGVSAELWGLLQIGACATGRYAGRVVVPVIAPDGVTWLGWVARSWRKGVSRPYLNARGDWHHTALFNGAALTAPTQRPVYVVEGVFDAIALWPDAVGICGKPTAAHREILCTASRPIVVVLDGDAWELGWSIAQWLTLRGRPAASVRLPPRTDPSDGVSRQWIVEQAINELSKERVQ